MRGHVFLSNADSALRRFFVTGAQAGRLPALWPIVLLLCAAAGPGSIVARAQTIPGVNTGLGTCADGTPGTSSEQCRQHLCATGWAQAHGYGSACGQSSSPSSAVNSALGDALSQGAYQIGNAIGWKIRSLLFGSSTPSNTTTPAGGDADRERQQQLAAQRDAKFRQEMQELSLVMKGPKLPSETKPFEDHGSCIFSDACNQTRELEFKKLPPESVERSFSNPFDQLRISTCLANMAKAATSDDEAAYLSEEAAKAANGGIVRVDVSGCASGPAPPRPTLTAEQTAFYKGLLDSTNQQMDRLLELQQRKVELEKKKAQLEQQIETQKQAVAQLSQQGAPAPAGQTDSAQQSSPPDARAPKASALAEAEAALRESEQALSDTQKTETEVDNEMEQVGEKIKQNEACFDQAQGDLSQASGLGKSCAQ